MLKAYIERLIRLAYSDCPAKFPHYLEVNSFIDIMRAVRPQEALRLRHYTEVKYALIYALEYEAAN